MLTYLGWKQVCASHYPSGFVRPWFLAALNKDIRAEWGRCVLPQGRNPARIFANNGILQLEHTQGGEPAAFTSGFGASEDAEAALYKREQVHDLKLEVQERI